MEEPVGMAFARGISASVNQNHSQVTKVTTKISETQCHKSIIMIQEERQLLINRQVGVKDGFCDRHISNWYAKRIHWMDGSV